MSRKATTVRIHNREALDALAERWQETAAEATYRAIQIAYVRATPSSSVNLPEPSSKMSTISLRVPAETLRQLEQMSKAFDGSRGAVIDFAVAFAAEIPDLGIFWADDK